MARRMSWTSKRHIEDWVSRQRSLPVETVASQCTGVLGGCEAQLVHYLQCTDLFAPERMASVVASDMEHLERSHVLDLRKTTSRHPSSVSHPLKI